MNRPLRGLMHGVAGSPGLPAVALGYGWLAHFVGYQAGPSSTAR
jgi:hypothetical protein